MTERERILKAIATLEAQRATLGDTAVDLAIAGLRRELSTLASTEGEGIAGPEGVTPPFTGERKLVTVMFADIAGFSVLSEEMDPEHVRDTMNGCFERLVPVIEEHGGTVDKFMGDGMMVLFGAPVTHEDDPERALHAALDMMRELAVFNGDHDTDLGLHFGINTGPVIAGHMGTRERQQYSVMGDAVNIASHLEDVSERGQILVGPDTYRMAMRSFEFKPLEPIRLRGRAELTPVYQLLGPRADRRRVTWQEAAGMSSSLVGRDAELAAVNGYVERLLNGHGGIISIIGDAGVGKSRLVADVRARNTGQDGILPVWWLEGRSLSFGQIISYLPFQEMLWQYTGISEDDTEGEVWRKLETRLSALFGEKTPEMLPYLAILLGLRVRSEYADRVDYLDGEAMRHQVFLVSRRFFERLTQVNPVVLVFEDLHWVDESSALLIEHLLPLVERIPLLICCVSRPDPHAPAVRLRETAARDHGSRYGEIRLAPLSRRDSAQLVRNLLVNEILPPRLREVIVQKAEGNPFFLEEIIRSLIDSGAIVRDQTTGRWRATAQIETIAIPDTIQEVIMARVDRLGEDVRRILRTAAVIGRTFLYRILSALEEADRELDDHISELQALEFIREKQRVPELEYIFKHALAQEAAYESVLLHTRKQLHAEVGQVIETLWADRLEEFYSLLAYHYARAEVWEKAHSYLLKTGDQAGRLAADAEALAHYRQALAAYERAFGDAWDPLQRATLERKMGEALLRRGGQEEAIGYFYRALAYLGKPLPVVRWRARLTILSEVARQVGHRLLCWLSREEAKGPISPALVEEIRLTELLCWIDAFANHERFLLLALKTMNESECSRYSFGIAQGSMGLGLMGDFRALFRLAEAYHRRALAIAEDMQHPGAICLAGIGMATHNMCLAKWDAAVEHAHRTAEIYRETGDLHRWALVSNQTVDALSNQGRFAEALVRSREIVRLGQDGADPQVHCWGLSSQGSIQRRLGQFVDAVTCLREARQLAEETQDHMYRICAGGELARCRVHLGQLPQALTILEESRQFQVEHSSASTLYLPYFNGVAEVYLAAAEQSDRSRSEEWLKKTKDACREALKHARAYRGLLPEAMRLQGSYEWLRGRSAAAWKLWQRSLAMAERLGQPYDLGMTHLEMGQRLGEQTHLERAQSILTGIGAEWHLARVRDALRETAAAGDRQRL